MVIARACASEFLAVLKEKGEPCSWLVGAMVPGLCDLLLQCSRQNFISPNKFFLRIFVDFACQLIFSELLELTTYSFLVVVRNVFTHK